MKNPPNSTNHRNQLKSNHPTTKTITTTDSLGHLRRRSDAQLILSHPIISKSIQDLHNQKPTQRSSTTTTPYKNSTKTTTIHHGLPSPPTTIGSENGSLPANQLQPLSDSPTPTSLINKQNHPPHKHQSLSQNPPSTRIAQHYSSLSSAKKMKPTKRESLPAHFNSNRPSATHSFEPQPSSGSASLRSKLQQPKTIISPPPSISRRSSTADGPMSSQSFDSHSTTSTNYYQHHHHHHHQQLNPTTTSQLSSSVLSNTTLKPHRTPSESSSTDLRLSKLKLKDRSNKEPSSSTLNQETSGLPRSKRLIGMKERNERIFASINASLHSPPRTHPPEPSLPPPPPSTSSESSNSPPSSSPKRSSGNLRVPAPHHIRSGLIPFAKGCSPSPRKITIAPPSQPSNALIHNPPSSSTTNLDPESTEEDEKYGSVRHKRPERCRLVKRTSPLEDSQADLISPPHSERIKTLDQPDQERRRQIDPRTEQYLSDTSDLPISADLNPNQSHRNSRTWSESISMHTSSSDTIGARDSRTALRSASRSSVVHPETTRHRRGSQHWDDEQIDSSSDHELVEDDTMTTPIKGQRSDSFQKTLRNASSISQMLNSEGVHTETAPVGWTHKSPSGHRRPSSSLRNEGVLQSSSGASPLRLSQNANQSPQSHHSISHRQRPGLPDHFAQTGHSEHAPGSETIRNMAEIRRRELHSSLSPRSNRIRPSTGIRPQPVSDNRSYRHSETFVIGPDRLNGVESALSRYDGHHIHSSGTKHQSVRNKHASWSALDDVGGDLVRSQSVLGVYDPHDAGRRGITHRPRTGFPSPISRRTITYYHHGVDDDDDGQTSTTTYTNTHSMPRKTDSAGSRSRTSEWTLEDHQDTHLRSVRAASRIGGHPNNLVSSPSRTRLIGERDRTLRGNGSGAAVPQPKPFAQLLRNTYQDKNSPNQYPDNRSSSSGASSKPIQSQRVLGHRQLSSAKLTDSLNRSTRPPTRATSSVAGNLTALLSPTPNVDHHRLIISAYEALDHTPDDGSPEANELNFALNGLLSSVVKNSCKIDATLSELNELSLNHQVEMELADDYVDAQADEHETYPAKREPSSGQIAKQKYRMMKDNLAHVSKVQSQLVRSSNDQIRDLTEVLICLSKIQRSQKEQLGSRQQPSRVSGGDDTRDSYGYGESQHPEIFRSGNRASQQFSHSHSPSKLRHTIDLSPLSAISSNDESPLSRAKTNGTNESTRQGVAPNRSGQQVANLSNGFGPQHQRASTISFTHNRELSFDGVKYQQVRAKNRMSAMSSTSIRRMGESFYQVTSNGSKPSQSRRNETDGDDIDEFGLYRQASDHTLRSPADPPRPGSAWSRAATTTGHTIRGSQSSIMIFPKTPPRLPTSCISQTTAHSNVSPTNPARHSVDSEPRPRASTSMLRPQSSMSKILYRANSVLSRVEHYPVASTLPSTRKLTLDGWERCSGEEELSIEDSRTRRTEPNQQSSRIRQLTSQTAPLMNEAPSEPVSRRLGSHRRTGQSSRVSSSATTALERLTRIGTRSRIDLDHDQPHGSSHPSPNHPNSVDDFDHTHSDALLLPHSSSSSSSGTSLYHQPRPTNQLSGSNSSSIMGNQNQNRDRDRDHNRRRRKSSIQSLFGGLKRSSSNMTSTFSKK